jgi:hypothetical protein
MELATGFERSVPDTFSRSDTFSRVSLVDEMNAGVGHQHVAPAAVVAIRDCS